MNKKPRLKRSAAMTEIGWREIASLPDLGIMDLHAKVDTGARTSALHAVDIEVLDEEDGPKVGFHVPLPGVPRAKRCVARLVDHREIKNTSGVPEHRYVIETTLVLGHRHWHIEVSLADRENMEFDLLLGRTAIRGRRFLINPGRSFLAGPPEVRRTADLTSLDNGLLRTLERGNDTGHIASAAGDDQRNLQ